ncbi:Ras guanine nucleotide exchange factor bud5, partial [Coemansia biformis]
MAFYYSRGDYEERIDECSQHTLLAATDAFRDRLSLALDEEQTVRTPHPESMTSMPRRREKYGEALRIAKQGLPRREKRLAKKLADPGADSGNRSRAGHGRSQPETQPILASGTNEVLINSEGRVSYGSWRGLVAYLTQICQPSDDYTKAFFLAFRSFATPSDLASALISRGAELLRARQASSDTKAPNTPTQTALAGVFRAIKHWYEVYWYSEADDPTLQTMCAFLIRDYLPSCQGAEEKECRNLLVAIAGSRDNIDISSMFAASEAKTTHAGLKHGAAGDDKRDGDSPAKAPQPRTKKGAS